ncbi:hypothetical protein [Protofrankia symbiont of Coriaria ruscifolia]|uniref:hypothetical protein n=1 Tax=Protofrankia symbiont of Coriaria ruscifolia TaxID=1306542 RepID=UPI001F5E938E|nr:hypothetical protein [Protofrankia symbiont of Coriaria ruscifolia]
MIVLFAGLLALLALLGLLVGADRRAYALDYVDRLIDLAAVLVGHPRPSPPRPRQRSPAA